MPHQCTTCGHVFEDGSKEMLSGCPECNGTTFQFQPDDADRSEMAPDESPPQSSSPTLPSSHGGRVGKHVGRATSTVREWMAGGTTSSDTPTATESSTTSSVTESDTAETPDEKADQATADTSDADGANDSDANDTDESEHDADVLATGEGNATGSSDRNQENAAQASARSEFVPQENLPPHSSSSSSSPASSETPSPSSKLSDGHVVREPTDEQPDLAELRQELNDQFECIKIVEPGQYELNLMELYDREEYIIALQENGRYVIQMPESWRSSDD